MSIGEHCVIDEGVRIRDAVILPHVHVKVRVRAQERGLHPEARGHVEVHVHFPEHHRLGLAGRVMDAHRGQRRKPPGRQRHDPERDQEPVRDHPGYARARRVLHPLCAPAGDVTVLSETMIRNCIVLPHKELKSSFHNEILM